MYKVYEKNGYTVMEYSFDSIIEFLDYLENTETNTRIWGRRSLASNDNDYSFTKSRNLKEAMDLCKYGYHDKFDKLVVLKSKLEKYIKLSSSKLKQYNDYVGYVPDVKAYLEGNPLSMLNKQSPKKKHIDIYFNSAILADVEEGEIYNRGAITLSLVEILESMGFSVGLNVFTMSSCGDQIHYSKFNLKNPGERINIQKLYFPLCHPSFLRRLVFRLREETPDISSDWTTGYGKTCSDGMIRRTIDLKDNDIVICQPQEMNVRGYDIEYDADSMFRYIEKSTHDTVDLEPVKQYKKTR